MTTQPPQGLLVHRDNHFIVNGPEPPPDAARLLLRKWEMPTLGSAPEWPAALDQWSICTRAFRENLTWAVVIQGGSPSAAVATLLDELEARGVPIRYDSALLP
jgi:hypothetical protein